MIPRLVLLFLGPPACGKGTQARRLAARRGLETVSTGDLLRTAVSQRTPLGLAANSYMDAGKFVPDDLVLEVLAEALKRDRGPGASGFILDGFPRTVGQAEGLDRMLSGLSRGPGSGALGVTLAVHFRAQKDELIRRTVGRRVCSNRSCQATYHVETNRPKKDPGKCDLCGSPLEQRADDREEKVDTRVREYEEKTPPLLAYYRKKGTPLEEVDANRPIERIAADLDHRIDELGGSAPPLAEGFAEKPKPR